MQTRGMDLGHVYDLNTLVDGYGNNRFEQKGLAAYHREPPTWIAFHTRQTRNHLRLLSPCIHEEDDSKARDSTIQLAGGVCH
jgi:hypothetical protein